jgi:aspartokinase-like uncharacterized kinase
VIVVKLGGSLFDHPRLQQGLRAYLDQLDAAKVLLVAGGGAAADAVRQLDNWQKLGEELAHELALQATEVTRQLVLALLEQTEFTSHLEWPALPGPRVLTLWCPMFLKRYETVFGPVPHTWELTTDSIAAYAAATGRARLILLKSVDIPPGTPWEEAAARGWVDAHFPTVVREQRLNVEAVNFRAWLDAR